MTNLYIVKFYYPHEVNHRLAIVKGETEQDARFNFLDRVSDDISSLTLLEFKHDISVIPERLK